MVVYFQSKICIMPCFIKVILKIILLFTIGNTNIKMFQYEKFYDQVRNKIIYTRYYISLPDSKNELTLKNRTPLLFKPVISFRCSL